MSAVEKQIVRKEQRLGYEEVPFDREESSSIHGPFSLYELESATSRR